MDAIIAITEAAKHAGRIKSTLKPELAALISEEFQTDTFWMDRISPTAWFSSERELIGFVFNILMNQIEKKTKTLSIQFLSAHVLDAWTETVVANNPEEQTDFVKLKNGVMVTISELRIRVFDADDLEVNGSEVEFKNIVTRNK